MNREIRMAVSLEVAGQQRCVWTEVRIGDMTERGNVLCLRFGEGYDIAVGPDFRGCDLHMRQRGMHA